MKYLLILLILSLSAFSQEVLVLNLERASEIALKFNREIRRLKNEIMSLEDTYRAQKWDRFAPKVDFLADRYSYGFFSEILLLDLGNRLARIRSAKISTQIKEELLKELERQVKIRIVELFMKLALAEKKAEVRREEMAVAYVRFDRERDRLEQGLSDRVKVAEWESTYRRFRSQLLEAQREYNETLLEIKRFLGLDLSVPVEISLEDMLSFEVPENKTIDTSYLLRHIKDNYLVRVKELEMKYFESKAQEEKRIFYPELYGYLSVRNYYEEAKAFRGEANILLRVPLFDGRASFYRVKSFLDRRRAVEIEKKDIEESLKRDFLKAPYDWDELVGKYEDAVTFDNWAQENLDLSRSNYELELAFDLGYAMSTKTEAERRVMEAKFNIILYLMRLYAKMGKDPMEVFKKPIPFFVDRVEEI